MIEQRIGRQSTDGFLAFRDCNQSRDPKITQTNEKRFASRVLSWGQSFIISILLRGRMLRCEQENVLRYLINEVFIIYLKLHPYNVFAYPAPGSDRKSLRDMNGKFFSSPQPTHRKQTDN